MSSCKTLPKVRPDGLYVDRVLVKQDATVEDFCKAKGLKELIVNNKVMLSGR